MTTLVNALEQRGGRYGLQTMCEGGGMANATIIERLGYTLPAESTTTSRGWERPVNGRTIGSRRPGSCLTARA
jgi:hypothetical protein